MSTRLGSVWDTPLKQTCGVSAFMGSHEEGERIEGGGGKVMQILFFIIITLNWSKFLVLRVKLFDNCCIVRFRYVLDRL